MDPRDARIARLERENAELKNKLALQELKSIFHFVGHVPRENQKKYAEFTRTTRKTEIKKWFIESITRFNLVNEYLIRYGLKISRLELVTTELYTGLDFEIRNWPMLDNVHTLEDFVYFKDRFDITDGVWIVIKKFLNTNLPTLYTLKEASKRINQLFPICNIINRGHYVEPSYFVCFQINSLFRRSPEIFTNNEKIVIKIELDGFQVARQNNLLNFSFAIINEGKIASTASGTYLIGVFSIEKENYDELEPIVSEIWDKFKVIRNHLHQTKNYLIEYINCCDHKMQAIVIYLFQWFELFKCSNVLMFIIL